MSSEQQKRKQLEKAIQDKLKKSGKVPVTPPAQTTSAQPTSLLSKTSTQQTSSVSKTSTQDVLPPLQKTPLSRRAPSPEPDPERPITTFLEPIKPKKPLKPKKEVAKRRNFNLQIPDSYYMAYPLIIRSMLWIFLNPQRYLSYAENATEKQGHALSSAQKTTLWLLFLGFFAIPLASVSFGLFPVPNYALRHNVIMLNWLIGAVCLGIIFILLAPFSDLEKYGSGLFGNITGLFIRIPILILNGVVTFGIVYIVFFFIIIPSHTNIIISFIVSLFYVSMFMGAYMSFVLGQTSRYYEGHIEMPHRMGIKMIMQTIHDLLEEFMETGIRAGRPTLINILM
ncbi:MAG: hypothetical protein KJ043_12080, partial [Anaerolineae bacterium]|nr:hypothetical protein [Anaerolineae bacterium]